MNLTLPSMLLLAVSAPLSLAVQVLVPQDHPTIAQALAAVQDGDTLRLAHGTYAEDGLVCNREITLLGDPEDPAAVLIDGDRHGRILDYEGVLRALVRGITFRGGDATGESQAMGGAIRCMGALELRIRDCRFIDCHAVQGGGVAADADTRLENCRFEACRGSAVYIEETPLEVLGCRFEGNRGQWGAAVQQTEGGFMLVDNSMFVDNRADSLGGALWNDRDLYVQFSTFLRNQATIGGDIYCLYGDVRSCTFVDSRADQATAICFCNTLTLEESVLAHGRGAGVVKWISPFSHGWLYADCCNFFNNTGPDFVDTDNYVYPATLLSEDPLFCDPDNNDVSLAAGSPCLPSNNSCGVLLGAVGRGTCPGPAVHPEFRPSLTHVLTGHEMQFIDLGTGGPDHWNWDLDGDGQVDSREQHPSWTYTQPGVYDVTLATGNAFHEDTVTIEHCVTARTALELRVPEDMPDIAAALAMSQWGDTVDVACGVWPARDLAIPSGVTLRSRGGHPECATLQGSDSSRVIHSVDADSFACVSGFRITGGMALDPGLDGMGGGIFLEESSLRVQDCIITGNQARFGGGVLSTGLKGGRFRNCTIAGNTATINGAAIGGLVNGARFEQCLVTANPGHPAVWGSAWFSCSDIHGNPGGDWTGLFAEQESLRGNFSLDPMICSDPPGLFRLEAGSPCLSAACGTVGGNPLDCQGLDVEPPAVPDGVELLACYPNPFNAALRIRYQVPHAGPVDLRLLDIRGRRVLAWQALALAGHNETGLSGEGLASGVYFVELVGAGTRGTRKVLLVK